MTNLNRRRRTEDGLAAFGTPAAKKSRNYFFARPLLLNPTTRGLFGSPYTAPAIH